MESPLTNLVLPSSRLRCNYALRGAIEAWRGVAIASRKKQEFERKDIEFAIQLRERDFQSQGGKLRVENQQLQLANAELTQANERLQAENDQLRQSEEQVRQWVASGQAWIASAPLPASKRKAHRNDVDNSVAARAKKRKRGHANPYELSEWREACELRLKGRYAEAIPLLEAAANKGNPSGDTHAYMLAHKHMHTRTPVQHTPYNHTACVTLWRFFTGRDGVKRDTTRVKEWEERAAGLLDQLEVSARDGVAAAQLSMGHSLDRKSTV